MKSKVTIIVPVLNTADFLEKCIESIKKINFQSYQVIFVDNCSSDGSYEILKKNRNKRFKIVKNTLKNFNTISIQITKRFINQ